MLRLSADHGFALTARNIHDRHRSQTPADVEALREKWATRTIFPKPIPLWDAILRLKDVVDPTDRELLHLSQWVHTVQVVAGMVRDGASDDWLYLAAWVHDLGKLLLLTDEDPANVVCDNFVIAGEPGVGLDNCVVNWNHDEFVYDRLKHVLPADTAWLVRYHSVHVQSCLPYFSAADHARKSLLFKFRKYDKGTKSLTDIPAVDEDRHKELVSRLIPGEIRL